MAKRIMYGQYDVPSVDVEVNFKVGQPAPAMLPLDKIRKAAAEKFKEEDPSYLQYGDIPGYKEFRLTLANYLTTEYGAPVSHEDLFVTNGVTGGLTFLCILYTKAGDTVFVEDPSYFLALRIFKDFNLNVVQIPMEKDGISVDGLEKALKEHGPPKFLYTIPTAQNPTGRTMTEEKRKKVVGLAEQHNFHIVADEVYHLLCFPGNHGPLPMPYYDTSRKHVFSVCSFSKILAPALRLGWIQAPPALLKPIVDSGMFDSSGGINPVISGFVQKAIEMGIQKEHLAWTREELHRRATHLMECCDKFMPKGVTYEKPLGGYFVLLQLPDGLSADELLEICIKEKVGGGGARWRLG